MAAKMDNQDLEFQISQYIDGQLDPRQRQELEARLHADPAAAELLRQYKALQSHLGQLDAMGLDGIDFDSQRATIMASLERKALLTSRQRRVFVLRPAFIGAVAAAAVVLLAVTVGVKFLDFGSLATDGGAAIVKCQILPPAGASTEDGKPIVQAYAIQLDEAEEDETVAGLPSGTVLVSIPQKQRADEPVMPYMQF